MFLAAVFGTYHIERNKAAKTLFSDETFAFFHLFLPECADVCLSLAGGQRVCNLFLDLARFAICIIFQSGQITTKNLFHNTCRYQTTSNNIRTQVLLLIQTNVIQT